MKIIKYRLGIDPQYIGNNTCLDICEIKIKQKIGSISCQECEYNIMTDLKKKKVLCGAYKNENNSN